VWRAGAFTLSRAQLVAVAVIVVLTYVNMRGVEAGAFVQNLFTVLKVGAIALLVGIGFASGKGSFANFSPLTGTTLGPSAVGMTFLAACGVAMSKALFAYDAWNTVTFAAEEIREPQRNLPRALVLGMLLVAACYLLANVAYLHALGHAGLATSTAPAAEIMRSAFGDTGARAISLGIAISTFGFCNISIIGAARVFQVMAEEGLFFRAVGHINAKYRSPDVALVALSGWAIVLALSGTYGQLLNYSTVGDWLGYAAAVATLFYYRRARADEPVAFKMKGFPLLPLIFIVAVLGVVASNILANPTDAGMGLLIALLGLPVYWFWSRSSRAQARA
jgi:APA family basic amino acid/polyamine antiporter